MSLENSKKRKVKLSEAVLQGRTNYLQSTRLYTAKQKDYPGRKRSFDTEEEKQAYQSDLLDKDLWKFKQQLRQQGFQFEKLLTYGGAGGNGRKNSVDRVYNLKDSFDEDAANDSEASGSGEE